MQLAFVQLSIVMIGKEWIRSQAQSYSSQYTQDALPLLLLLQSGIVLLYWVDWVWNTCPPFPDIWFGNQRFSFIDWLSVYKSSPSSTTTTPWSRCSTITKRQHLFLSLKTNCKKATPSTIATIWRIRTNEASNTLCTTIHATTTKKKRTKQFVRLCDVIVIFQPMMLTFF